MDDVALRMAKIGGAMLIIAAFLILILALLAHLTWFTLIALLAAMALTLRLNVARLDRKFARSRAPGVED